MSDLQGNLSPPNSAKRRMNSAGVLNLEETSLAKSSNVNTDSVDSISERFKSSTRLQRSYSSGGNRPNLRNEKKDLNNEIPGLDQNVLQEVRKSIWDSTIPTCLVFYTLDKANLPSSKPNLEFDSYFMLLPRRAYFSFYIEQILNFLFRDVLDDPDFRFSEVWLESSGSPLKWHYPIGLLFDMYNTDNLEPWTINIRYGNYPTDKIFRSPAATISQIPSSDSFFNTLKEAAHVRFGNTKKVANMPKNDQIQLWDSVFQDDFDKFWQIQNQLLSSESVKTQTHRAKAPSLDRISLNSNHNKDFTGPDLGLKALLPTPTVIHLPEFKNIPVRLYLHNDLVNSSSTLDVGYYVVQSLVTPLKTQNTLTVTKVPERISTPSSTSSKVTSNLSELEGADIDPTDTAQVLEASESSTPMHEKPDPVSLTNLTIEDSENSLESSTIQFNTIHDAIVQIIANNYISSTVKFDVFDSDFLATKLKIKLQGLDIPLSSPLIHCYLHLVYPDGFIHIVICYI